MLTGKTRRTRWKTCPSTTLSTANTTWTELGAYPSLRCESPATNHLSHGISCRLTWYRPFRSRFEQVLLIRPLHKSHITVEPKLYHLHYKSLPVPPTSHRQIYLFYIHLFHPLTNFLRLHLVSFH